MAGPSTCPLHEHVHCNCAVCFLCTLLLTDFAMLFVHRGGADVGGTSDVTQAGGPDYVTSTVRLLARCR